MVDSQKKIEFSLFIHSLIPQLTKYRELNRIVFKSYESYFNEYEFSSVKAIESFVSNIDINEFYFNLDKIELFQYRKSLLLNNDEEKNYFTISSHDDFSDLPSISLKNNWGHALVYTPLNDHSRVFLKKGDVLFCYRQGQFASLKDALDNRGIYAIGFAATDPIELFPDNLKHERWGILVTFPQILPNHLELRNIQSHPDTIELTPYNGNRNDALQHIPEKRHYSALLNMIISRNPEIKNNIDILFNPMETKYIKLPSEVLITHYALNNLSQESYSNYKCITLPKPFLLLAGISGTGKTRFVSTQAKLSNGWSVDDTREPENYKLIPVRPDWHEPSDLLGYVSRINGTVYIPTKFLELLISAWKDIFENGGSLNSLGNTPEKIRPFWLCLDEMNLAPVEQYFADYLSILETRKWVGSEYKCNPILTDHMDLIQKSLNGLDSNPWWVAFKENKGIPIPPNLIVAGTVNMDETTHGFSRKVIDRALTLDFGEFFPNDFNKFFNDQPQVKSFQLLNITDSQSFDFSGKLYYKATLNFMTSLNVLLQNTPFELAYRALNEIFLSLIAANPEKDIDIQAVWDDYLMMKVLPRIEGDSAKLRSVNDSKALNELLENTDEPDNLKYGKGTILHDLWRYLSKNEVLGKMWDSERLDLFRVSNSGEPLKISCRSRQKIEWMLRRLKANHYTDFWA